MHQIILSAMGVTAITLGSYVIRFSTKEEIPTVQNHQIQTLSATLENTPQTPQMKADMPTEKTFGDHTLYEVCMYKFIATEGIVLDMYSCAAGYKTFGIGCVADTPEERALVRSGLTYAKVRKHLEEEWLKMMAIVERDAPHKYSQQQKAALAMLFLSIGYERFWAKNKPIKQAYKEGNGIPESKWLKQCNYFSTKYRKYVRSENLYRSKRFEVALFKGDNEAVTKATIKFRKDAITIQKRLSIWSNSGSTLPQLASLQ